MSKAFSTLYTLPSGEPSQQPGRSDYGPIILSGIKADEFLQFLRLLYPEFVIIHITFICAETYLPNSWEAPKQTDEQISVGMSLASRWGIDCIYKHAVEALEQLDLGPARKLELARIHGIGEWIGPELIKLAARRGPETLTIEEAKQIGAVFTAVLLRLRDQALVSLTMAKGFDNTCKTHFTSDCTKCRYIVDMNQLSRTMRALCKVRQ